MCVPMYCTGKKRDLLKSKQQGTVEKDFLSCRLHIETDYRNFQLIHIKISKFLKERLMYYSVHLVDRSAQTVAAI